MKAFEVLFKALGLSFQRTKDPSKGGRALLFCGRAISILSHCSYVYSVAAVRSDARDVVRLTQICAGVSHVNLTVVSGPVANIP